MKMRLYKTSVCSPLTHACEAWDMTDTVLRTLNGFNSTYLSVIFICDIKEMAADPPFDLIIRRRKLRFLGDILRMEQDRLVQRNIIALTKGTLTLRDLCSWMSKSLPLKNLKIKCMTRGEAPSRTF